MVDELLDEATVKDKYIGQTCTNAEIPTQGHVSSHLPRPMARDLRPPAFPRSRLFRSYSGHLLFRYLFSRLSESLRVFRLMLAFAKPLPSHLADKRASRCRKESGKHTTDSWTFCVSHWPFLLKALSEGQKLNG